MGIKRDVVGRAVQVMRVATGEETLPSDTQSAAKILGSRGGKARAANLTPARRKAIARNAAIARWKKDPTR